MQERTRRNIKKGFKIAGSIIILVVCLVLASAHAFGIDYNRETLKQDLLSMEWCFDSPFGDGIDSYRDYWTPYALNENCKGLQVRAESVKQVTYYEEVCDTYKHDCVTKDNKTTCEYSTRCRDEPRTYEERHDLDKEDFMLEPDARICLTAKRQPLVGSQACDINIAYDDGITSFDVKDDGKQWFNASCARHVQFNIANNSELTAATAFPLKLVLNGSGVNYSSFQDWNVTFTQDNVTSLNYWNATPVNVSGQSIVYVNTTINVTTNTTLEMYYNCSFASRSNLNATFGGQVSMFLTMNDYLSDISDRNQQAVVTNTPVIVRNDTDIIERRYGYSSFARNDGDRLNFLMPAFNNSQTILVRARSLATPATNYSGFFYAYAASKTQIRLTAGTDDDADFEFGVDPGVCSGDVPDGFIDDDWHDFALRFDDAGNNFTVYYDGRQNNTQACTETGLSNPSQDFPIGAIYNNQSGYGLTGFVDELIFIQATPTADWIWLWHDQPEYSEGLEDFNVAQTTLELFILNESWGVGDNTTDEGEEFRLGANYSYDLNGSSITDAFGHCNYTALNISRENYTSTPGTNITVCDSGCDTANYTSYVSGFPTDEVMHDLIRLRLCHTQTAHNVFVGTGCNASYTIPASSIPLCSGGYVNYTIVDNNCSALSGYNVSVWDGNAITSSVTLVDTFVGIDRIHNETAEPMYYNATNGWWYTPLHEYYDHGSYELNVSCAYNTSNVENQSGSLSLTVVNVPPVAQVSTIWWWLLTNPVAFANGVSGKYPLMNTLNITGECTDDDLANATVYLNYSNGSNINTSSFSNGDALGFEVNYSNASFLTTAAYLNGSSGYTFHLICWDDQGNSSEVRRNFTAENDQPVATWSNSSPLSIPGVPVNVSWTCVDDELEDNLTVYLWFNASNLTVAVNETIGGVYSYLWNLSEGSWNNTIVCEDSFWNSSQDDLVITYTAACLINYTNLCDGCRYQDDTIVGVGLGCSNGASLDSCYYSTNDYAWVSIGNCSLFNISAERGWNRLSLVVTTGGVNGSDALDVWAKKLDATIWDFPVIMWLVAVALLFVLIAAYTRIFIFHFVAGVILSFVGWELLAFSTWAGFLCIVGGSLYGIVMMMLGAKGV